ncbi:MAG: hypothetical protein MN733_36030 [Nitrososphaera sp.]|nr:hypothetical protein [Nitrososphaera sp.]
MDPEETARFIIGAILEGNIPEAAMALGDLQEWFVRGGFPLKPETQAALLKAIIQSWTSPHQPKPVNIDLELEMARNLLEGRLISDIRRRLQAVVNKPTQKTWSNAYSIILNPHGRINTLWQAVMAVDPTFPNIGPRRGEQWERIPSQDLLLRAIRYVTH